MGGPMKQRNAGKVAEGLVIRPPRSFERRAPHSLPTLRASVFRGASALFLTSALAFAQTAPSPGKASPDAAKSPASSSDKSAATSKGSDNSATGTTTAAPVDNTAINARDKSGTTVTPQKQSNKASD